MQMKGVNSTNDAGKTAYPYTQERRWNGHLHQILSWPKKFFWFFK